MKSKSFRGDGKPIYDIESGEPQPNTSKEEYYDDGYENLERELDMVWVAGVDPTSHAVVKAAKQEILKHFKALIEESKPEKRVILGRYKPEPYLIYGQAIDQYHSNLLKRVE